MLFDWLKALCPTWPRLSPENMFAAPQMGLAALALSGCTMSSDHLDLYPNGVRFDDTIAAALTIGLRFHAPRGSMSIGERAGGLPPAPPPRLTRWAAPQASHRVASGGRVGEREGSSSH